MSADSKPISTWRKVFAGIFDFLTIFFVAGYAIGYATGGMTKSGFKLDGAPALALFAVIVVYFFVGRKYAGGTLWQRILAA
jgi:hypothetical protein